MTPSSKVVGDLAQFMVHNSLSKDDVRAQAKELSFPNSVIDMMQGGLGLPEGGFPEPLRSDIVGQRETIIGRPGENMDPIDFRKIERELTIKHPGASKCSYFDSSFSVIRRTQAGSIWIHLENYNLKNITKVMIVHSLTD